MRKPKDWGQPCPNPACTHYRRMQQGNVSAIATYLTQSGKRRIFRCHSCELPFSATRETVFFDLRTSEEKVMMALKMLLVRGDLAGSGFVLGVTEETVLAWLSPTATLEYIDQICACRIVVLRSPSTRQSRVVCPCKPCC